MSLEGINLRKLLRLMMADRNERVSLLREDIRSDLRKQSGEPSGGGDFFVPFWAAAKSHVRGETNLSIEAIKLVALNTRRRRLYPMLAKAFLEWWNEKRAWRNEPFTILNENIKGQYSFKELGLTLKVENLIGGRIGDQDLRLVYPYFSESPVLSMRGARLGIFLLHKTLPLYSPGEFRIFDVLRSISYSVWDVPMTGNEEDEFASEYKLICREWAELRSQYA